MSNEVFPRVKRKKSRSILPLDLVPLIDIVFLLLIFFMLTATFTIQPGIKVKLPQASTSGEELEKQLTVYITDEDVLYLNREKIDFSDLKSKLKYNINKNGRGKMLIIKADENARHGIVVKVMDIANAAGIDRLMVAAEKD